MLFMNMIYMVEVTDPLGHGYFEFLSVEAFFCLCISFPLKYFSASKHLHLVSSSNVSKCALGTWAVVLKSWLLEAYLRYIFIVMQRDEYNVQSYYAICTAVNCSLGRTKFW